MVLCQRAPFASCARAVRPGPTLAIRTLQSHLHRSVRHQGPYEASAVRHCYGIAQRLRHRGHAVAGEVGFERSHASSLAAWQIGVRRQMESFSRFGAPGEDSSSHRGGVLCGGAAGEVKPSSSCARAQRRPVANRLNDSQGRRRYERWCCYAVLSFRNKLIGTEMRVELPVVPAMSN